MPENGFRKITGAAVVKVSFATADSVGETNVPEGDSAPFGARGTIFSLVWSTALQEIPLINQPVANVVVLESDRSVAP